MRFGPFTCAAAATALGLALVGATPAAYGMGVGGSENTTTTSTSHLAVAASTGHAKVFDFGPVLDPTPPNGCQVTITWGDGQTSVAGLGPADSNNEQEVTASHTYAPAGAYTATQSASAGCATGTPT